MSLTSQKLSYLPYIMNKTGYGSRTKCERLLSYRDEQKYEQWEIKFPGYMQLQKLKDVITAAKDRLMQPRMKKLLHS